MIEVKHYNNQFNSNPIHKLRSDFGPSNTDTTSWRPEISIARAQAGINSGKKLVYDFPDGKDNGELVQTFIRSKGLDITEIESAEKRITTIIEDKNKRDKEKKASDDATKKFNDNIQKLADSVSSNPSNPSNPS